LANGGSLSTGSLNRLPGNTVNFIQQLHTNQASAGEGFLRWITSAESEVVHLRILIFELAALVAMYALLRYLREVASSKMSMELVFYLREAIYDKVQRVGFGFHDAISSGQLINRALSDLQNVRQFVQTAILTTLEIILVVIGNIALVYTRNHWLAALGRRGTGARLVRTLHHRRAAHAGRPRARTRLDETSGGDTHRHPHSLTPTAGTGPSKAPPRHRGRAH
jgi:ABC-type multidrug transport system fused ATPase/permease subunit